MKLIKEYPLNTRDSALISRHEDRRHLTSRWLRRRQHHDDVILARWWKHERIGRDAGAIDSVATFSSAPVAAIPPRSACELRVVEDSLPTEPICYVAWRIGYDCYYAVDGRYANEKFVSALCNCQCSVDAIPNPPHRTYVTAGISRKAWIICFDNREVANLHTHTLSKVAYFSMESSGYRSLGIKQGQSI